MSCTIQINQNRRKFSLWYNKIFALIICGKISTKFSGKLHTGIFDQLCDAIFDNENFSCNYE